MLEDNVHCQLVKLRQCVLLANLLGHVWTGSHQSRAFSQLDVEVQPALVGQGDGTANQRPHSSIKESYNYLYQILNAK